MTEINLLKERKRDDNNALSREQMQRDFVVDIEDATISSLENATNKERQEILNNLFNEDRREAMTSQASLDSQGARVRYYRYLNWDRFIDLLKTGNIDAQSGSRQEEFDENAFRKFLVEHYKYLLKENGLDRSSDKYREEVDKAKGLAIKDLLDINFPSVSQKEKKELLNNLTFRAVKAFNKKHTTNFFKRLDHYRGLRIDFSPYLSVSVGGIITEIPHHGQAYLELVLPDSQIRRDLRGEDTPPAEKDILVENFDLSQVSRVFMDRDQINNEIVENTDTGIGRFLEGMRGDPRFSSINFDNQEMSVKIGDWKVLCPTEDCLPVSLKRDK